MSIFLFPFLLAVVLAGGHASNGAVAQGSQYDNDSNNATVSPFPSIFAIFSPISTIDDEVMFLSDICWRT